MVPIMELWLPILLATILCFFSGFLLHMALPLHRKDWRPLPDEEGLLAAMRRAGVTPGNYMFSAVDMEKMKDPVMQQKLADGPCGVMTIRPPGAIKMGPYLFKQLLFHLVVSIVIAYLVSRTLAPGTAYMQVFRVAGTAGLLSYIAAIFPEVIWYSHPPNYVMGKVLDGVVWGLLTAGSFAGFWPK
jgi:hypothetical protein